MCKPRPGTKSPFLAFGPCLHFSPNSRIIEQKTEFGTFGCPGILPRLSLASSINRANKYGVTEHFDWNKSCI